MVVEAESLAARAGYRTVELLAREELTELVEFWRHRGFRVDRTVPHGMIMTCELPLVVHVPTAAAMRRLGERLADLLGPGDVVIATGELGAGKTTLTQGIGRGLGTAGRVISPTFVLSRIHPSTIGRPRLVHVDAYRLGGPAELDDLDLDATVADSVTVVEWGRGVAEGLAADRLEIDIWRSPSSNGANEPDSERVVTLRARVGPRWSADRLAPLTRAGDDRGPSPSPGHRHRGQRRVGPGTQVLAAATVLDRMAHAEQLMPRLAEVLSGAGVRVADLDRIVVGLGPDPSPASGRGGDRPDPGHRGRHRRARRLQPGRAGRRVRGRPRYRRVPGRHRCPTARGLLGPLCPHGIRIEGLGGRSPGRGPAAPHGRPGRSPLPDQLDGVADRGASIPG